MPLTLNLGDRVESLASYLLASGPFNKTLFLKVDATLFVSIHDGQLSLAQNISKYIPILIISKYKVGLNSLFYDSKSSVIYDKNFAFHVSFDYFFHWQNLLHSGNEDCYVNLFSNMSSSIFCIKIRYFKGNSWILQIKM